MENKIKQRIVGALVLIGLVAVMLSILFHNENSPDKNLTANSQAAANPKVEIIFSDQAEKVAKKHQELAHTQQQFAPQNLPQTETTPAVTQAQMQSQKIILQQKNSIVNPIISVNSKNPDVKKTAETQQVAHREEAKTAETQRVTHREAAKTVKTQRVAHREAKIAAIPSIHGDAWVIQMGSFRDKALALRLENKLKENGYKTYIHKISGHRGVTYNVRVGPMNQKEAKKLQHQLATVVKLKGFLLNEKNVKNELA